MLKCHHFTMEYTIKWTAAALLLRPKTVAGQGGYSQVVSSVAP